MRAMSGRTSAATERALTRHLHAKETVSAAARAEGINVGTLFRALARQREGLAPERTLIVGAGALGRELASWLRRWSTSTRVEFLDDAGARGASADELLDRGIVGAIAAEYIGVDEKVLLAIADPAGRASVAEQLGAAPLSRNYVDPTAVVGHAEIGPGSLLLPFTLLSDRARIGRCAILNTYSSIGHDCVVGDFCTLASYVCIAGRVTVGNRVAFGMGANVLPDVTIGDDAVIGAGAVVVKNVQAGQTVFGNPARVIA